MLRVEVGSRTQGQRKQKSPSKGFDGGLPCRSGLSDEPRTPLEQALAIVSVMKEKECQLEALRIVTGMQVSDELLFDLLVAANHGSLR